MSQQAEKSETFLRFALTVLDHVKGIRLSKEVHGPTLALFLTIQFLDHLQMEGESLIYLLCDVSDAYQGGRGPSEGSRGSFL